MKRTTGMYLFCKLATISLLALMPYLLQAQTTREQMGGVYYAYPAPSAIDIDEAPAGYEAFYILHYGRHGSRWLPSDSRYEWVLNHFADKKRLTREGIRVRKLLSKVWKNARGNGGQLTPLGAAQQRGLAQRMSRRFPSVFATSSEVRARSSVVGRCRESMLHFTDELQRLCPHSTFDVSTDSADMRYIAYTSPELKALEQRTFPKMEGSPQRFIQSLFKDPTTVSEPERLLSELHTIASDMQDVPLPIDLYGIFTDEEFADVYQCNNRRMVFCNGLHPLNEGLPALSATSLWEEMEQCAETAIAGKKRGASLRFGHETMVLPLVCLMDINGFGFQTKDLEEVEANGWWALKVFPMAANLQFVFYRESPGDHDVLVKVLLNEKEAQLPVRTDCAPYYHWADVRRFYLEKLDAYGE